MKQTVKKLLKSGICLMLVFCMLLSFAPATALTAQAAEDKQDTLIYVSIGDSMTNGYCLPGYDGVSGAINYAMETYSNKFAAYLAGYDGPVVDNQVIFEGEKRTVDHRQLAISGMRAQDIQWVLELDYENDTLIKSIYDNNDYFKSFNADLWYGTDNWNFNTAGDRFTYGELVDSEYRYADAAARIVTTYFDEQGDGFEYYESEKKYNEAVPVDTIVAGVAAEPAYPQGAQEAAMGANYLRIATEFYQKSMADADIISLGVGNTNFGTFMLNKITNLIMGNDMSFSQTFDINKAIIQAESNPFAWEKVKAMVGDPTGKGATEAWTGVSQEYQIMEYAMTQLGGGYEPYETEIKYIMKYAMITFMSGYIGMLDAILELNPDAQIIMIALMNSYAEDNGTTEGTVSEGTLGELVQYIYTPVNAFLKNLAAEYDGSHEYAKFYFAEAPYVSCMVDVFGDDYYKDVNGNFVEYKGLLNEAYDGKVNSSEGYTANVGGVVRERFAEEILKSKEEGGYFFPNVGIKKTANDIRPFLYGGEVTFTVNGKSVVENTCGVIAYDMMTPVQKAYYAAVNPNSAQEYAYYLAFENALIVSGTKNITMKSLGGLGTIETTFRNAVGDIKALIGANSKNYYADAAVVVAAGSGGALTEEDVVNIMMAVEQVKAGVWADAAEYHETLATSTEDGGLGHPTIDHILQCDKCMDTNAGEHYANPIIKAIVDAYNEQMAELPYVIVTEMVKEQAGDFLTVGDIKTLCQTGDSAAYKDAVYAMIIAKAAENHFTMTNEHIDLLITEDGAFKVASLIAMNDTKYANMIKNAYYDEENAGTDADPLEPDQRANITMLLGVRDGVITLLAPESESTLKNGAEGIPEAIKSATLLAMLLAQPKTMSEGLNANEGLQGALTMNARCLVGTGAGAHPSTDGHQALYKAVFDAFDFCSLDGHTPVHGDATIDQETGLTHGKIVCDVCGEPIETFIYGDVNGDGAVNGKDVTVLRKYQLNEWSGKYIAAAADMDGNGTVDGKDVTRLRKYLINEYVITIK